MKQSTIILLLAMILCLCACGEVSVPETEPVTESVTEPTVPQTLPVATAPPETQPPLIGWVEIGEKRYYYDGTGNPVTGWLELEDGRYFLDLSGASVTGWLEWDGRRFYLDENGRTLQGKVTVDDRVYFLTSEGEEIPFTNRWNPVPKDYQVDLVESDGCWMDSSCIDALDAMLWDLREAVGEVGLLNGYRSYTSQYYMFYGNIDEMVENGTSYQAAYSMISESVALPGTSEHQLGLAVDIMGYSDPFYDNGETDVVRWLKEHCWDYGFIIRYPEGKSHITGIIYEPWHYRYVGNALAMELKDSGLCLEEYFDMLTGDGTTCGNPNANTTDGN